MSEQSKPDIRETYEPILPYGPSHRADAEAVVRAAQSEAGQEIIELESTIIGARPESDVEAYLVKHNQLLDRYSEDLEARIPGVKANVIDRVSTYLARGDDEVKRQYMTIFEARLAATQGADIIDPLLNPATKIGDFKEYSRRITVNAETYMSLEVQSERRAKMVLDEILLPHELLHGMSTAQVEFGAVDNFIPHLPVRLGIGMRMNPGEERLKSPMDAVQMAQWVNEGFIEDFRSKAMQTDEVGYKLNVMVIRLAKEFDPELELVMEQVEFGDSPPGVLIGRLEAIFGPMGVERMQEIINQYAAKPSIERTAEDHASFRDSVIKLVDDDKKAIASKKLDRLEQEVVSLFI